MRAASREIASCVPPTQRDLLWLILHHSTAKHAEALFQELLGHVRAADVTAPIEAPANALFESLPPEHQLQGSDFKGLSLLHVAVCGAFELVPALLKAGCSLHKCACGRPWGQHCVSTAIWAAALDGALPFAGIKLLDAMLQPEFQHALRISRTTSSTVDTITRAGAAAGACACGRFEIGGTTPVGWRSPLVAAVEWENAAAAGVVLALLECGHHDLHSDEASAVFSHALQPKLWSLTHGGLASVNAMLSWYAMKCGSRVPFTAESAFFQRAIDTGNEAMVSMLLAFDGGCLWRQSAPQLDRTNSVLQLLGSAEQELQQAGGKWTESVRCKLALANGVAERDIPSATAAALRKGGANLCPTVLGGLLSFTVQSDAKAVPSLRFCGLTHIAVACAVGQSQATATSPTACSDKIALPAVETLRLDLSNVLFMLVRSYARERASVWASAALNSLSDALEASSIAQTDAACRFLQTHFARQRTYLDVSGGETAQSLKGVAAAIKCLCAVLVQALPELWEIFHQLQNCAPVSMRTTTFFRALSGLNLAPAPVWGGVDSAIALHDSRATDEGTQTSMALCNLTAHFLLQRTVLQPAMLLEDATSSSAAHPLHASTLSGAVHSCAQTAPGSAAGPQTACTPPPPMARWCRPTPVHASTCARLGVLQCKDDSLPSTAAENTPCGLAASQHSHGAMAPPSGPKLGGMILPLCVTDDLSTSREFQAVVLGARAAHVQLASTEPPDLAAHGGQSPFPHQLHASAAEMIALSFRHAKWAMRRAVVLLRTGVRQG